jgi:hypothetical protein
MSVQHTEKGRQRPEVGEDRTTNGEHLVDAMEDYATVVQQK